MKFEVYFSGGANGFVNEKELAEMIRKELANGFEPTVQLREDGRFVFDFFHVIKGETKTARADRWPRANKPLAGRKACLHKNIESEDYLNPCSMAACKQHGVYTYHLGCGSQYRDYCADCGAVLLDSAREEIEGAGWEERLYICSQCEAEGVQPGHFACGSYFRVPI